MSSPESPPDDRSTSPPDRAVGGDGPDTGPLRPPPGTHGGLVRSVPGGVDVVFAGEVDFAVRPQMQRVLLEVEQALASGEVDVRVDLGGVTFMDSTGIELVARLLRLRVGVLVLDEVPDEVAYLLRTAGIDTVFEVHDRTWSISA